MAPGGYQQRRNFESGNIADEKSAIGAIHSEPENFSPNALLRPVVQDFLLPTVAYIGGPSEISYFAQSEVLYRNLLGRMPVMLPRAGFTVVDTKAQRLLKQYGLEVEDVWVGPQELRKRLSKASLPEKYLQPALGQRPRNQVALAAVVGSGVGPGYYIEERRRYRAGKDRLPN